MHEISKNYWLLKGIHLIEQSWSLSRMKISQQIFTLLIKSPWMSKSPPSNGWPRGESVITWTSEAVDATAKLCSEQAGQQGPGGIWTLAFEGD